MGYQDGAFSAASNSVFQRWAEVQRRVLAVFQRFGPPTSTPPDMEFVRRWTERAHPDLARQHEEAELSLREAVRQEMARREVPSIVPAGRFRQLQAENDYHSLGDGGKPRARPAEAETVVFPAGPAPALPPAAAPASARDY
jgi:hypothetical protein